jgi:hypothetical protein
MRPACSKEGVEPMQIVLELQGKVREPHVQTVLIGVAACCVDIPKPWSDDEDFSVTTHQQQPLEVGDGGRHGDLMDHHQLPHHILVILLKYLLSSLVLNNCC